MKYVNSTNSSEEGETSSDWVEVGFQNVSIKQVVPLYFFLFNSTGYIVNIIKCQVVGWMEGLGDMKQINSI